MGGTDHQFQVGKVMKNLTYGTLFIIFVIFGSSVSAQNCPKDPLPVSRKLDRVLNHAENEMEKQ